MSSRGTIDPLTTDARQTIRTRDIEGFEANTLGRLICNRSRLYRLDRESWIDFEVNIGHGEGRNRGRNVGMK